MLWDIFRISESMSQHRRMLRLSLSKATRQRSFGSCGSLRDLRFATRRIRSGILGSLILLMARRYSFVKRPFNICLHINLRSIVGISADVLPRGA